MYISFSKVFSPINQSINLVQSVQHGQELRSHDFAESFQISVCRVQLMGNVLKRLGSFSHILLDLSCAVLGVADPAGTFGSVACVEMCRSNTCKV
jgi:hypothetical protein